MNLFVHNLRIVWVIFYMQLKQMAVDAFVLFIVLVQPLLVALVAIYMLRDSAGFQAIYVIVGSAMTGLWSGTLFFCTRNVDRERWSGTLESIIGSPTDLRTVMLAKSLANVTLSLSSMLFSYPLAAFVFGYSLTVDQPLLFGVSMFLTVMALVSFGMLLAPLMALNPGSTMWNNTLEFPVYILGGFLFSIALLPAWTTPVSYALTPYWAARVLHETSSGGVPLPEIFRSWVFLIGYSVIYWFISTRLFQIVVRRAREDATLGLE